MNITLQLTPWTWIDEFPRPYEHREHIQWRYRARLQQSACCSLRSLPIPLSKASAHSWAEKREVMHAVYSLHRADGAQGQHRLFMEHASRNAAVCTHTANQTLLYIIICNCIFLFILSNFLHKFITFPHNQRGFWSECLWGAPCPPDAQHHYSWREEEQQLSWFLL